MAGTPALRFLEGKGVAVTLHPFDYDARADAVGLGLKTKMVQVDGRPASCVIPRDRQLAMKKVAVLLDRVGKRQGKERGPAG